MKFLLVALALFVPATAGAFSEGFKKEMTSLQLKVMLKGQRFTIADAQRIWDRFDEEVASLLSQFKSEVDLNREGASTELSVTEHYKEEIEIIELGDVEAKFFRLDSKGKEWLVSLSNDMGTIPTGTFHIYGERDGKLVKVGAMEEASGPWEREGILFSSIQVQPVGPVGKKFQFNTYHMPYLRGDQKNRSQIVWEYGGELKATHYVAQVDWHTSADGTIAKGRGPAVPIP